MPMLEKYPRTVNLDADQDQIEFIRPVYKQTGITGIALAMRIFCHYTGLDMTNDQVDTIAVDMIADLLHVVRAAGGNDTSVLEDAEMHFDAEVFEMKTRE